mgnify:CR=1 FL=1
MCIAVKYGIWNVSKPDPQALGKLRAAGYPELAARVLAARGIADAQAAHAQLDCSCELPSPYLLTEMDVAAGRVGLAMSAHEKIAVFGDYDVDGITATCLLTDFLRSCGADCMSGASSSSSPWTAASPPSRRPSCATAWASTW